jgi:hypothetical protein
MANDSAVVLEYTFARMQSAAPVRRAAPDDMATSTGRRRANFDIAAIGP